MVDSITFMIFAVFDVLLVVNIVYKLQGGAKNGATLSHWKYSKNSITELRGNYWSYAILYAEHNN